MIVKVERDSQIDIVEKIAWEIWTAHYTPIIGKKQVEFMLNKYQTKEAISNQIENEKYVYYLFYDEKDNLAGYMSIQFRNKELFLSKFYVVAAKQNKGYGKQAIRFLEDIAGEKNLRMISLTVNKNNINSIKAYEKMGFDNLGSVVTDIGNGFVMDDYKMVKSL